MKWDLHFSEILADLGKPTRSLNLLVTFETSIFHVIHMAIVVKRF